MTHLSEDYPEPSGYDSNGWAGWYFYDNEADAAKAAKIAEAIVSSKPDIAAQIKAGDFVTPGIRISPVEPKHFDGRYVGMYGVCIV